jgi:hypothetical protein
MDKREKVARAICAEKCAFMGEPPCSSVEGEWPNRNCSEPGCHAEAQAAIAALEPMGKPRVKSLIWKLDDTRTAYAQSQYFADRYCIEHRLHGDDAFDLWIGPDAVKATRHTTLESAKAAAQADYEARILVALEPVTAREEALRALLERALPLVEEGLSEFWTWDDDGPAGEGWTSDENTACREALDAWCAEVKKALGQEE